MIKFGTSGWRGIIAEEFTCDNVRIVTQAISNYIIKDSKNYKQGQAVIIGYDTRFMSEKFAVVSAEVLAGNKIKALLCKRNTPTPVIAFDIIKNKLAGGINFTASHNPPEYNGIKFSPSWGGPALPETTKLIEKYCAEIEIKDVKLISLNEGLKSKFIEYYDPRPAYIKRIKELVNFKVLKKSGLKVAVDLLYGTGDDYLDTLLESAGLKIKVINKKRDVLFGGHAPEPNEENLKELKSIVKKEAYKLGLSVDGDSDRFGIIDSDGTFIMPNQVIPILMYHLNKTRGWKGVVARSVMTSHMIDKLADKLGIEVKETPVGFKYIGELMIERPEDFIIGGEESGGLTIRGHVPEKDGILACLLMAEAVAMHKKSLGAILKDIMKLTGNIITARKNFHLPKETMEAFRDNLKKTTPEKIGGMNIQKVVTLDGYKFVIDENTWIGFRLSGTEPVVRLYAEAQTEQIIKKLVVSGEKFVNGK
ncbi:phosphoglucomutase/phosphomannomutase family protein [Elusimicrobiota bacterium]